MSGILKQRSQASDLRKRIYQNKTLYFFLIPAVVLTIIFCYRPMIGVIIAFQEYDARAGFFGSPFVGLKHFKKFLQVPDFYRALRNTVTINLLNMAVGFTLPIIFALVLNELYSVKIKRVVQTITYLPHFVSWIVIGGMVYRLLAVDTGSVNLLLMFFGKDQVPFMRNSDMFYPIFITVAVWKELGWNSIIYLAALQGIDPQLYEAAIVDGAGRLRCIFSITLPGIATTIGLLFILTIGTLVNAGGGASLEAIFSMRNPLIMDRALVVDLYTYMEGISLGYFSYAAAIGLTQSVVSFMLVMFANFISRRLMKFGVF